LRARRPGRPARVRGHRCGLRTPPPSGPGQGPPLTAPPSAFSPQGSTHVAAVIGCPVRHSLSPWLHNAAYRALGLDWVYVAFEVAPGAARHALDGMRALGIDGLNVTMPHKRDVAAAVDRLTPTAEALGA